MYRSNQQTRIAADTDCGNTKQLFAQFVNPILPYCPRSPVLRTLIAPPE